MQDTVLGVEIAVTRLHTSIVAAGRLDDGIVAVEVVAYLDGADTAQAVADVVAEREIRTVVVDPRHPRPR